MIANILINKKLNPIVIELFIRGRRQKISLAFITNTKELQQMAYDHSSGIEFEDFMNLYKKCSAKPYSFLVIDATVASDNLARFRNNLIEKT